MRPVVVVSVRRPTNESVAARPGEKLASDLRSEEKNIIAEFGTGTDFSFGSCDVIVAPLRRRGLDAPEPTEPISFYIC